jgi:hypothetical protein
LWNNKKCFDTVDARYKNEQSVLYSTSVHIFEPQAYGTDFITIFPHVQFLPNSTYNLIFLRVLWGLCSSGILLTVAWYFVANISGQPVVSVWECLLELWRWERQAVPQLPVTKYQPRTRNNLDERKKSVISHTYVLHMSALPLRASCLHYWILDPVKVKFTLEQATKTQRWRKGIALLFP